MSNNEKHKWNWRKLQQGRGIKVAIKGDLDNKGNQKYRPGIVIKSYPSHVKVQLLSTEISNYDYFSVKVNNITQYVRPIYFRTVLLEDIARIWKDDNDQVIELKKSSTFFTKIIEMQYKELFDQELDLTAYQKENNMRILKKEESELEI